MILLTKYKGLAWHEGNLKEIRHNLEWEKRLLLFIQCGIMIISLGVNANVI